MNREQTNTAGSTAEGATAAPALPLFLTVREYAAILRIRQRTVLDEIRAGLIPATMKSKRSGWRIPSAFLQTVVNEAYENAVERLDRAAPAPATTRPPKRKRLEEDR